LFYGFDREHTDDYKAEYSLRQNLFEPRQSNLNPHLQRQSQRDDEFCHKPDFSDLDKVRLKAIQISF